jgi:hypothetical protein
MTRRRLTAAVMRAGSLVLGQSAARGALPQLHAATAPGVQGGDYYGPRGIGEQRGLPKKVPMSDQARDDRAAELLWDESKRLTGVRYAPLCGGIRHG